MNEEPMERVRSEAQNTSEATSAHCPTQNLGDRSIRHRSPTSLDIVRFRNQPKLMDSRYLGASADSDNVYRKDSDENNTVTLSSARRRLIFDEADRKLNPPVNTYRGKKSISSNSSENAEFESSAAFATGFSRVILPELKQKNNSTLTHEFEKLTEKNYKAKFMNYFLETMVTSDLSSVDSSPEKDKPFRTKNDLDKEYFPDTESTQSLECKKGTTSSYKSFRSPEKNMADGKTNYDDDGYFPDGESTSSSESQESAAKSKKLFSQSDYAKGGYCPFKWDPFLNYYFMKRQLDEICQNMKKKPQSDKRSLNASSSDFTSSYEEINASNSHNGSLLAERMNHIKLVSVETSHINKPTVLTTKRHSSTPELRETNAGNWEISKKDKSCLFTESQTEHMLIVEGESVNNSCEQYSRKRKVDSSKNSPSDERKEKFFKSI